MIENAMRALEIATNRPGNGQNFEKAFKMSGQNRRFIHTDTGMMGLTHPACRKGDIVCVLFSGRTPFIVRPTQKSALLRVPRPILSTWLDGWRGNQAMGEWGTPNRGFSTLLKVTDENLTNKTAPMTLREFSAGLGAQNRS